MEMMRDVSNTRYRETVHACKCGFRLVVWPKEMLGLAWKQAIPSRLGWKVASKK